MRKEMDIRKKKYLSLLLEKLTLLSEEKLVINHNKWVINKAQTHCQHR